MVVLITNLTDGPNTRPSEVRIYSQRLLPGKSLRIPAQHVTAKLRRLEEAGIISIGAVPTWYADYKARRTLSKEEVDSQRQLVADVKAYKEGVKSQANLRAPRPTPPSEETPQSSTADETTDEAETEKKPGKRKRR